MSLFVFLQKKDHFCIVQRFNDIHTHTAGKPGSVLSIPVSGVDDIVMNNRQSSEPQYYSLQLHPWHLRNEDDIEIFLQKAHQLAKDPYFVAIGECGLDGLTDTPLPLQVKAFRAALSLADELQKPIIIHCVKLWAEIMAEAKGHQGLMIIHGFRKGPVLARQLLDAGFSISIGQYYHQDIPSVVPAERLFHETDEEA